MKERKTNKQTLSRVRQWVRPLTTIVTVHRSLLYRLRWRTVSFKWLDSEAEKRRRKTTRTSTIDRQLLYHLTYVERGR